MISTRATGGRRNPAATKRNSAATRRPERLEARRLLSHAAGHDPVIELRFDEPVGATTVTDSAAAGGVVTGEFAGDILPEIRNTDARPGGGNYVHLDGDGQFRGFGGRIDMSELLTPVLGRTSSLSFYIRTTQVGNSATWRAPGVTGAEQAGSVDDIFWGNLDPEGRARIQTGLSPISSSTPVNTGEWIHVTQTRDAATGRARTYVNGNIVSEAFTDAGDISAEFRAIGVTTDLEGDITSVTGYNYLNGDLDQVEVFNRELRPEEVAAFYGAAAPAVPASPAPATATAISPRRVTLTFANVANEAGYKILRSATAGGPFTEIGFARPNETTFLDATVAPGTQYFYQVVAYNGLGSSAPATASVTTPAPSANPVIVYNFNEGAGDRVEDTSPENVDNDGTLTGDTLPEFRTDGPSPAGGSYLHFEGDGIYDGAGSRVDADELLNPVLGGTSSLSFYIRTTQVGSGDTWQAPGVTGVEQADGRNHIYWGNLDHEGRVRVQADDGDLSASTPINTGEWFHVTHTRDAETGVVATYVDGVLVSQTVSTADQMRAEFRAFGATTDAANNLTTVEGYNHINADLDQIEVFERVLTPQEVARRYGPPAASVPTAPAPATAVANNPSRVTLTFTDVAGEAGYSVQRATSAAGPFTELATLTPGQTSYVDQTVLPLTQYFYRVVAFNQAGDSAPAAANVTTPGGSFNPVIVYTFNEGTGGTVANTGSGGAAYLGTLAGDALPTFQTANPSPAGGSYLHFAVTAPGPDVAAPTFDNSGGRVDVAQLLTPILGDSSTLSFYIRTTRVGHGDTWRAPGVTGGERAGSVNDIFWGNLGPDGRARIQTGLSPISSSTPVNTGQWVRVTQTRESTTGRARTYVNGVLISEAMTNAGVITAMFRAIGATTDVNNGNTAIDGYNYLDGDLDQIEVFDRALTPDEVARFYGAPGSPVEAVYVRGTAWAPEFMGELVEEGLGDANLGYRIASGSAGEDELPWSNVNRVSIKFGGTAPVTVAQDDLAWASGANIPYAVTSFAYDPITRVASWTLDKPLANFTTTNRQTADKVNFALDGDAGGASISGGDYRFRLNVVPGDANRNGNVSPTDYGSVRSGIGRNTTDEGTAPTNYTVFKDVNANGNVSPTDIGVVRGNTGANIGNVPNPSGPASLASITEELFGATPIL